MVPVHFTVFNRGQVDGLEPLVVGEGFDPIAEAEAFLTGSGVSIVHTGDRAFYRPISDVIQLPDQARFSSPAAYYGTALHELVHSTAGKDRCDRSTGLPGTPEYGIEELTAELGAAMLTGLSSIDGPAHNLARPQVIDHIEVEPFALDWPLRRVSIAAPNHVRCSGHNPWPTSAFPVSGLASFPSQIVLCEHPVHGSS